MDSLLVVPNDRMFELADPPAGSGKTYAAQVTLRYLTYAFEATQSFLASRDLSNSDRLAVVRILRRRAVLKFGTAKDDCGRRAAAAAFKSAALDSVLQSKPSPNVALLVNFTAGPRVRHQELQEALAEVMERARPASELVVDSQTRDELAEKLRVSILASILHDTAEDSGRSSDVRATLSSGNQEYDVPAFLRISSDALLEPKWNLASLAHEAAHCVRSSVGQEAPQEQETFPSLPSPQRVKRKWVRSRSKGLIAALDIGTTSVRCIVGETGQDGLDIVGIGSAPSSGIRKGVVVNIERTVQAIRRAVEEAEVMAGRKITEVSCSISEADLRGKNSLGVAATRRSEVQDDDVRRVLQSAMAVRLPSDAQLIHVLPVDFSIDDVEHVNDPRGISGARIEGRAHLITALRATVDNTVRCCAKAGLRARRLVFSGLAASRAVLNQDEKQLGVVLVDIGTGSTDYVVWFNGAVVGSGVVPLGGEAITRDIAVGLKISRNLAEKLKLEHGRALTELTPKDATFQIMPVGAGEPKTLTKALLAQIIEPRIEEILSAVRDAISTASNCSEFEPCSVVLTGGTAKLSGIVEAAEHLLGVPVRIGWLDKQAHSVGGITALVEDPAYAVLAGMALAVAQARQSGGADSVAAYCRVRTSASLTARFRSWLRELLFRE